MRELARRRFAVGVRAPPRRVVVAHRRERRRAPEWPCGRCSQARGRSPRRPSWASVFTPPLVVGWWWLLQAAAIVVAHLPVGRDRGNGVGGVAAAGIYALPANSALITVFGQHVGIDAAQQWGAALIAPFTEETSKALGIVVVLLAAGQRLADADGRRAAWRVQRRGLHGDRGRAVRPQHRLPQPWRERGDLNDRDLRGARHRVWSRVSHRVLFCSWARASGCWPWAGGEEGSRSGSRSSCSVRVSTDCGTPRCSVRYGRGSSTSWWCRSSCGRCFATCAPRSTDGSCRSSGGRGPSAPLPATYVGAVAATWWKRRAYRASVVRTFGAGALAPQRVLEAELTDLADAVDVGDEAAADALRSSLEGRARARRRYPYADGGARTAT